jgi:enoyl-CoA hydratase/carnithine racemase
MGACALLPRIIGAGRAADLLYTGRMMDGDEALANGFFNVLTPPEEMLERAAAYAQDLATGPTFAHAMTKRMLNQEWAMGLDEAIEAEAQAQAICMQTGDFRRAYEAFVAKETPRFEGG